ncbi:hypothetical protein QQS21_003680 [Conoideocrella luteorostrata]|uniref:Myb-like domain-containing protein n=1 Tax=Conoideocrella luteorostrata TaxID=1105319 RepID=A0AAJ0CSX0_9HYPO|nr:hypothetical protein QQS21_003680 [Conoideocrella luteorostrata]
MSSKNWNDRADKDLFFTILSVKNIGVISGAEWTSIGNQMRLLGYGFTNEGCRQHFQGLRRIQNKAEANGSHPANSWQPDHTMNPITRRPGPGRGRPRKQSSMGAEGQVPVQSQTNASPAQDHSVISAPEPAQEPLTPNLQHVHQLPHGRQVQQQQHPHQHQQDLQDDNVAAENTVAVPQPNIAPTDSPATPATEADVSSAPSQPNDGDDVEGIDEHPAKRQRLDTQELERDQPLDDEAVLALAAHNGAAGPDYAEEVRRASEERLIYTSSATNLKYSGETATQLSPPSKMAPKAHWTDVTFLHDLVVSFYGAGVDASAMTTDIRKDIEDRMRQLNHDVTWEGIR